MRLRVIGFWGGYPSIDEASSMYMLEKDGFTLLLDVGSGGLSKLQKYKQISDIDAVVLSHYHADHIADVGVLQHALIVQAHLSGKKDKLPIYGHQEDMIFFNTLDDDYTEAIPYDPGEVLKVGPFFIRFLRTKHSVPCFGMRITDGKSTLVYTADSAYQPEWIPFGRNADVLLSECNFYAGQDATVSGHMNSEEVAAIAKQAGINHVILTHLPHFGNHAELVEEVKDYYDGKVELAHEGLVWDSDS